MLMSDRVVTMQEFRQQAEEVVRAVSRGERLILTYRGRRAMRLVPIENASAPSTDDAFFMLAKLHETVPDDKGQSSLTNEEIDDIVYDT